MRSPAESFWGVAPTALAQANSFQVSPYLQLLQARPILFRSLGVLIKRRGHLADTLVLDVSTEGLHDSALLTDSIEKRGQHALQLKSYGSLTCRAPIF